MAVIINGRSAIHHALVKHSTEFADRTTFASSEFINPEFKGFIEAKYNADFNKYRHLSLTILKKFGFGQGIMERRIQVEVDNLLNEIKKMNGEAFSPRELVMASVANVIVSIMLGNRYEHYDTNLRHLLNVIHDAVELSLDIGAINIFPKLRYLPSFRRSMEKFRQKHDELLQFLEGKIDETFSGEIGESFISHFIDDEGSDFDRSQLLFTLRDFVEAGTETTSTTLLWAIVVLANNPDIQDRLRRELDSVVPAGNNRLPSLDDKPRLPFLEATILELLRWKTVAPLGLFHGTLCDTNIRGYFIPKGCWVCVNLYSAQMDPTIWPEPEIFRPERFLDADGRVINRDAIIAFSLGKRSCLGEILARQELFLYLAGIIQHFNISPPAGLDLIECHEVIKVTVAPSPYQVRLITRSS